MLKRLTAGLAFGIWSVLSAASAATLTVDGIGGQFVNTKSANIAKGALKGVGTGTIDWGTPWTKADTKSSYTFAGSPTSQSQTGAFLIGSYTHKNGTIGSLSDSLKSTDLNVSVSGLAGSIAYSILSAFSLTHNETLNYTGCPAAQKPCGDLVTIANKTQGSVSITDGLSIYQLLIDGFVESLGGPIVTSFLTAENKSKTLYLQASLVLTTTPPPPAPVPLPAGGVALLSGMAALAVLRRRRKA